MSIRVNDDGDPNTITYLFTDLHGNRIEELPITGVTFSLALNASGPFAGSLNIEDPRVQALDWQAATAPNLAQVWVDINGTLVYGGIVQERTYDMPSGTVAIKGTDHYGYLIQRLQAQDYSTVWATTPFGAAQIAYTVITDALAVADSLPLSVTTPAATPSQYGITLAAPISQRMTVDSIINQVAVLGWLVGFDYAIDVKYVAGVPTATLTLSYPRRGRVAGTTGLVIDTQSALAFTFDESGTAQATSVTEVATGSGGVATTGQWTAANTVGYPLLERVGSHASFSSAAIPQTVLDAYVANDLALSAYPVVTPQVTMPMFAEPAIGEWIVGDDVRMLVAKTLGAGPPPNPRFPAGMDFYWRITRADVTVPAEGIPTVAFTFNMPPSSTPQRPPQ
jgi:hypothetical protein